MFCSCNPNFHLATALTPEGLLTVTNSTNVGNFDPFFLRLKVSPGAVIVGAPVSYGVTINGTAVPIRSLWGTPIPTDRLCQRRVYIGRYIVPTEGDPYVVLTNVPTCPTDVTLTPFAPAGATTNASGSRSTSTTTSVSGSTKTVKA